MGVRLIALPDYLVRWRVPFTLLDGWDTRARSSGDFVDIMAIGAHHTASKTTPARDLGWMYTNAPDRPIGAGLLDRTGHWHLGSVRATNTQGKGGPYPTSRGTIPLNSGNTRIFAIEAANDGLGEPWPTAQIDTYLNLCAAIIDCVNETTPGSPLTEGDIIAHFEWAPGRKFDPAGNSPYATGGALWRMNDMRRDVYIRRHPPITPPLTDPEPPDVEDEPMYIADLSGNLVVVGASGVRPISPEELGDGVLVGLPVRTPTPGSNWYAWLDAARREYAKRVGMRS